MLSLGKLIKLALLCVSVRAAEDDYANNASVQLFQEYVQINTTTGNDLCPAVQFWRRLAEEEGLPINVYEYEPGYPVVVIKWAGTNSSLSSIVLNSHMDVVPANEYDGWTHPPFSGHITDDGQIFGRGTQDMKSVSMQYFEALRRVKANNVTLLRDVYMTLMPDEEEGGAYGTIAFLQSPEFAAMNVGFELDEGSSYDLPLSPIFYQDKVVWQIQVDCHGTFGHSSTFEATNSTAIGQCYNVINSLLKFRDEEYQKSLTADITNAGTYTSININKIYGGDANNVIPGLVSFVADIRPSTTQNTTELDQRLKLAVASAGPNVTLNYIIKNDPSPATRIDPFNPYWTAISDAAAKMNFGILPIVPPGSTDARHYRNFGIPAFGFSPMPNTPLLLHSVDEHLGIATFLTGINIYELFIPALANIPGDRTSADPSVYLYKTNM